MNKKNKITLIIVSLLLVLTITIGISYAYWKLSFVQTTANSLATDCFSITFTEDTSNIALTNAYPLLDADGEKLTPYTFTIKNNCTSYASYQVNLEVLNTSTLADSYLKMQLDSNTPVLLTSNSTVTKTLSDATTSYNIANGYLDPSASKTYNLRVWLKGETTMADPVQNKIWNAKVTLSASYKDSAPTDYEKCVAQYGTDSVRCKILSSLSSTTDCPTVNEDGTVAVSAIEGTKSLLCSAPDDYGTSYYYRGNVTHNYVKLGSYYFRIIRINGDGSVRMIYDGTSAHANNESSTDRQIGTSAYNYYWKKDNVTETTNSYNYYDNASVGYMYGNRDGIVEASTECTTTTQAAATTWYYATSYNYDVATDRFTLVSPVAVAGSAMTSSYVGYYTYLSTSSTYSAQYVYKVTSVSVSTDATIGYKYVIYGTTSKEKAQTNTNDGTIKAYLDNWYQTNLSSYSSYFSDTLYCNDRSLYSSTPDATYSQLGYGPEKTAYRLWSYSNSRLKCSQQNDRFTVDDTTIGNGSLAYPIGLLTTDEAVLAGGWWSSSNSNYLYTGNWYWTASPYI